MSVDTVIASQRTQFYVLEDGKLHFAPVGYTCLRTSDEDTLFNDQAGFHKISYKLGSKTLVLLLGLQRPEFATTDDDEDSDVIPEVLVYVSRIGCRVENDDGSKGDWLGFQTTRVGGKFPPQAAPIASATGVFSRLQSDGGRLTEDDAMSLRFIGGFCNYLQKLGLKLREPFSLNDVWSDFSGGGYPPDIFPEALYATWYDPVKGLERCQAPAEDIDVATAGRYVTTAMEVSHMPPDPGAPGTQPSTAWVVQASDRLGHRDLTDHGLQQVCLLLDAVSKGGGYDPERVGVLRQRMSEGADSFLISLNLVVGPDNRERYKLFTNFVWGCPRALVVEVPLPGSSSVFYCHIEFSTLDRILTGAIMRRGWCREPGPYMRVVLQPRAHRLCMLERLVLGVVLQ